VPVVRNAQGEKLSKQTGALAVQPGEYGDSAGGEAAAVAALLNAARFLGLHPAPEGAPGPATLAAFWQQAVPAWASLLSERGATLAGPTISAS